MDPVTGVGLAASVIQLVTFGIDAVKICREVYQQGSISEYSNVNHATGHLASLTKSLQQSLQSSGTRSVALAREDKDLVDLGRKCEDCASRLQKELHKLQAQPRAPALEVALKATRAIRKKNSISKIQEELETYKSTLEISLLSRLSRRFDAQGLRSDSCFASLDKNLQHIITCLANSQTSLSTLTVEESEQTRHYIATQIDRVERLHVDDRLYEEVTRSLFYSDIFSRQEQVDNEFDGIENTYDWIFDEPQRRRTSQYDRHSPQKWDDFARWLKSGHAVYWINGKAGSGKSTLMNHICKHRLRLELLEEWCSGRLLLTPTFFFWNAGTRLQKTIDGLLRSLIYQILTQCRALIGCFKNEPLHSWNQRRLVTTLLDLLTQSQVPVAICMFIDGLDEFEGQEDTLIKMIKDLANQTHVKICLSSRPLLAFEEAFKGEPNLRVQDLTFDSIRAYADHKLSDLIQQPVSYNENDRYLAIGLLTRMVERADGVFLWAIIAIREVRDGLRGFADMNELVQAIELLPAELESLFMLMLNRIKPAYKRDATQFLEIVLYHSDARQIGALDLCKLHLSHSQWGSEDAPFFYEKFASSELVVACRTLRTRLLSHTAGLLELTATDEIDGVYGEREDHDPVLSIKINFLHRTVRDFLLNNDKAKTFLARNCSTEAQAHLSIARGRLAQIVQFSRNNDEIIKKELSEKGVYDERPRVMLNQCREILEHISMAERLLGAAQSKLMRSLDYEPFVLRCYIPERPKCIRGRSEPFMITGNATSIDFVGMAAAADMKIYVCERLHLSVESRSYSPSLPDFKNYSRNRATTKTISWIQPNRSREPDTNIATRLGSSSYRQALVECLQWKAGAQLTSRADARSESDPLAETYMLSCCTPYCRDLVRILLAAGANPMVQVEPIEVHTSRHMLESFWEQWLRYLLSLRYNYIRLKGKSGGLVLGIYDFDLRVTLNEIFDTTKALLAQGTDINYQLEDISPSTSSHILKHLSPQRKPHHCLLKVSAMCVLEECFNAEPEFRRFADAIAPLVKEPTREIACIYTDTDFYKMSKKPETRFVYPSAEESEMLCSLIEKWESFAHLNDLDALQSALERVWRAHNPGIELVEVTHEDD